MKNFIISIAAFYSAVTLGYQVQLKNGKAFITPDKIQSLQVSIPSEVTDFCSDAKRYLNQFKGSMERNNCLEQGQDQYTTSACRAVKRAFQRVATAPGVLGTDLLPRVSLKLKGGKNLALEEARKEEIASALGLLTEQVVYPSKAERTSISKLLLTSNHEQSIFSIFPTQGNPRPYISEENLHFSDRLTACGYLQGDITTSATIIIKFGSVDKTPQRVFRFFDSLEEELKRSLVKYTALNNVNSLRHEKSLDLLFLAQDFSKIEKEVSTDRVLRMYDKVSALGKMDLWWKLFFETDEETGVISLKHFSKPSIRNFYQEEQLFHTIEKKVDIVSEVTHED
jgi:hypothetical protein